MSQVLDDDFGDNEGEDREQQSDSDEQVAGAEAAPAKRFKSKNGEIFGSSVPHDATANVTKMSPGTTRFAVTRVSDVK